MIGFLNGVSIAWWQWMVAMTWQVILLALVVWLIDRLLRNTIYPQVRYALWLIVFIKLIIPPQFGMVTGVFQQAQPAAEHLYSIVMPADTDAAEPAAAEPGTAARPEGGADTVNQISPVQPASASLAWQTWPFLIWLLGMGYLSARLGMNIARLQRWHRQQRDREIPQWFNDILLETAGLLGTERLPAVVFSDRIHTPAVYGFFRPVLLLPRSFEKSLSREEMRYMVLHEFAHIRRGDLWIHGFTMLLQIVYWFNPVILWANRQLKNVREICCDATVAVKLAEDRPGYRQTLIGAARRLLTESVSPTMGLLGVFEEPYYIVNRIKWLERDMSFDKFLITVLSIFVITFFLAFIIPMAPLGSTPPPGQTLGAALVTQGTSGDEGEFFYARQETVRNTYALGAVVKSDLISVEETWFTPTKAVLQEEGRRLIVDLDAGTYTFINQVTETYVKTTIPLDVEKLYDDETRAIFYKRNVFGDVSKTDNIKDILGYHCREYIFQRWEASGGRRVNTRTMGLWIIEDPQIDTTAFDLALDNRRKLYGFNESAREELREAKGFQAELDWNRNLGPIGVKAYSVLKEIGYRTPPADLFKIPDHFRKKDTFSKEDF